MLIYSRCHDRRHIINPGHIAKLLVLQCTKVPLGTQGGQTSGAAEYAAAPDPMMSNYTFSARDCFSALKFISVVQLSSSKPA